MGGLLTGQRQAWDALPLFVKRSPMLFAHRITAPLLIIHGEDESGAYDRQGDSQRLFSVLAALGRTARYVRLRHEGHFIEGRDSLVIAAREVRSWYDSHLKAADPRPVNPPVAVPDIVTLA